jgi:hypothetical protein
MNLRDILKDYQEREETIEGLKESLDEVETLLLSKTHEELTPHLNGWGLGFLCRQPKDLYHYARFSLRGPSPLWLDKPAPGATIPVDSGRRNTSGMGFKLLNHLLPWELYQALLTIEAHPDMGNIPSIDIVLPEEPLVWLIHKDDVLELSFLTDVAKSMSGIIYGPFTQKLAKALIDGHVIDGVKKILPGEGIYLLDYLPRYG